VGLAGSEESTSYVIRWGIGRGSLPQRGGQTGGGQVIPNKRGFNVLEGLGDLNLHFGVMEVRET